MLSPSSQTQQPTGRTGTFASPGILVAAAVGIVGLGLGIVALAASLPWVGLLAGLAALAAGAAALTGGSQVNREEIEGLNRRNGELEADLDAAVKELEASRRTIAELTAELAQHEQSAELAAGVGGSQLTDTDTGLFSEPYFHVALGSRIAAARRHLRPVAVALIEVAEGQAATGTTPAPPTRAAEAVRQTVRDADTACRLDDGTFAIILEDTPENGAVWTVERIRRNLVSRYGPHTMWAGVACYPAHAFSSDELLEQSRIALVAAREWNQDRIEVAIAE